MLTASQRLWLALPNSRHIKSTQLHHSSVFMEKTLLFDTPLGIKSERTLLEEKF